MPSLQVLVDDFMNPGRINTPVAFAEALAGRIIPRSLLATPAGQQSFADAVVKGKNINVQPLSVSAVTGALQPIAVQMYTTGRSSKQPDSGALVNSAWATGTITLVYAQGWTSMFPLRFLNLALTILVAQSTSRNRNETHFKNKPTTHLDRSKLSHRTEDATTQKHRFSRRTGSKPSSVRTMPSCSRLSRNTIRRMCSTYSRV